MNNLRIYTRKNLRQKNILSNFSITTILIAVNVILFLLFSLIILINKDYIQYIALTPANFVQGKYLWTVFTSMFMHANLMHLFFNMFSLYFIGKFVERIVGRKRFLVFYIISGIFAALLFAVLSGFFGMDIFWSKIFGDPTIGGVGASGAVFGLLGLLALLTPKAKVYLILGPLLALVLESILSSIGISASLMSAFSFFINIYFVISLIAIISFNPRWLKISLPVNIPFWMLPIVAIVPLMIVGFFWPLPIGNIAHLGGFIAGVIYGVYLRNKYPNKIKMLNRYIRAE